MKGNKRNRVQKSMWGLLLVVMWMCGTATVGYSQEKGEYYPGMGGGGGESATKSSELKEGTNEAKVEVQGKESSVSGVTSTGASESEGETEDEEPEYDNNIGLSASVGFGVGQGIFVSPIVADPKLDLRDTPGSDWEQFQSASWRLSLGASYSRDDHSVDVGIGMSQSLIGGRNEPQDFFLGDLGIGYGWSGIKFESINSRLSAGAGLSLPTSRSSIFAGVILGVSANVSFSVQLLESLSVGVSVGGSKTFHKSKLVTQPRELVKGSKYPAVLYRGSDIINGDFVAVGGVHTEWGLSTSLSLSWRIWVLRISASYGFSNGWTYDIGNSNSEFNPQGSSVEGRGIAKTTGRRYSQSMNAGIGISYGFDWEWLKGLSVSLRASSGGSPKTEDNLSFAFPFWNFDGAAKNSSSIGLTLSYGYQLGF